MKKSEETPEEIFLELQACLAKLGWLILMKHDDDGAIPGIITGPLEFLTEINNQLEDDYDVYESSPAEQGELH